MKRPLSFDELRIELMRRRLPRRYVERVVRELEDHAADIAAERHDGRALLDNESLAAAARLGDLDELADLLVSQHRARSFVSRHPFLMFVLTPIPLAAVVWIAFFFIVGGAVALVGKVGGQFDYQTVDEIHPAVVWSMLAVQYAGMVVPWMLTVWVLSRWFARSGRGTTWLATGCMLVALFAYCVHTSLVLPTGPGSGSFSVGLGFTRNVAASQLVQLFAPIATGVGLFVATRWRSPSTQTV